MRSLARRLAWAWALPVALGVCSDAHAEGPTAPQLLGIFDAYNAKVVDRDMGLEFTIFDSAGLQRVYEARLLSREGSYRMSFTQPGDMRNSVILIMGPERVYVTEPGQRKIRRFAAPGDGPLLGSSFTFGDFITVKLADLFDAAYVAAPEGKVVLRATMKPSIPSDLGALEFFIESETGWLEEIRFYDRDNTLVRTETRMDPRCDNNVCVPTVRRMVDHRRHDLVTEARVTDLKVNRGISPNVFSLNHLKRTF